MKTFKMVAVVVMATIAAVALSGCQEFRTVEGFVSGVSQATVTQKEAYLAAEAYDVAEITGTNYMRLRRCSGTNGPICRDPAVTRQLDAALLSGRSSRNNLKAYLRAHVGDGETAPITAVGDFNALNASIQTIKALTGAYAAAVAAR